MTMQDAHNLRLRLQRQGDTDAAEAVGVLIAALEAAAETVEGWCRAYVDPQVFLNEVGRQA